MKKRYICLLLVLVPFMATNPAVAMATIPAPATPVLITEIQPGTAASASEEFIEIYNTSSAPINLTAGKWQLQITSSVATSWESPLRTILLTGMLQPKQTLVVASQYNINKVPTKYLSDIAGLFYSPAISATGGHIRLVYIAPEPDGHSNCIDTFHSVDQVEWSGMQQGVLASPSWDKRTPYATLLSNGIDPTRSLQRVVATNKERFVDTEDDNVDFSLQLPTPGTTPTVTANTGVFTPSTCGVPADPPTEPSEPPSPPADTGSDGEPDTGSGSADTGDVPAPDATLQPNNGLLAPSITELLPNPAAPQTDANDEFIELYNSNAEPFDVSGYMLETGEATKHRYVLPNGTLLAANSWTAFLSRDTGLSLANTGGRARLLDTLGVVVAASDPYTTAADGQAWAYIDGMWQWSSTPTPGLANVSTVLPAGIKKAVTITASKKPAAVKAATTKAVKPPKATKTPKQAKPKETAMAPVATTSSRNQLHTGVLATVGGFALLYGAYEYRSDITNKFHQFRRYRADRRKSRPSA